MTIRVKQYRGKLTVETDDKDAYDHLLAQKNGGLGFAMEKYGIPCIEGNNYSDMLDKINDEVNTEYDDSFDVRTYTGDFIWGR
ncbi:MAG: hypothetical protein J7K26_03115 [Candidatus Aenigmarchaeota archaeon]|nr:hypothetical protein [Candidatus Aenigmarchaeota archaeon]